MDWHLPSPKSIGIFLLATTGTIYGLFETLSSVGEVDTFLSNPFVSVTPSPEPTVVLETQQTSKPDNTPKPVPAPSKPTVTVSIGTEPSSTATNNSVTVTVGFEDTNTGATVTTVPTTQPSQGTASTTTTKVDLTFAKPTPKPVITSNGSKPVPKPATVPAPKSPAKKVSKPASPKPAKTNKVASSAKTQNTRPASLKELTDWWNKSGVIPTSKQIVNANGEDEYDEQELKARFARSKWNAIWIQHIDYMLLAPNNSKVWEEQAQKMKKSLASKDFTKYFDTVELSLNIPLFGRFFLKEHYPLKGKYHPSDPYMIPWNGPNLAAACKSLTEWTPNGAWWMSARGEIWDAAWNFCVKPSKIAKGIKPSTWLYQ